MALFGSKKNTKKAEAVETKAVAVPRGVGLHSTAHVIRKPRITEKAAMKAEKGVYVFDVATTSTKASIARAVNELYNVTVVRVAVAAIPEKKVMSRRGVKGTKRGGKKAYVYIKEGQTIEFV